MPEAVEQLATVYPDATPEELSNAIASYIEEVLPQIIVELKLPQAFSPIQLALRRFRLKRMRQSQRELGDMRDQSRERFLTELRLLRYSFSEAVSSDLSAPLVTASEVHSFDFRRSFIPDGQPALSPIPTALPMPLGSGFELLGKRQGRSTTKLPLAPTGTSPRVNRVTYDNEMLRVLSEQFYQKIFRDIEQTAREFVERSEFSWTLNFALESDIEMSSWKRFILRLSVPGADFDKKIRLWDELDTVLRKRIRDIAEETEDRDRVRLLTQNLFLRMELE